MSSRHVAFFPQPWSCLCIRESSKASLRTHSSPAVAFAADQTTSTYPLRVSPHNHPEPLGHPRSLRSPKNFQPPPMLEAPIEFYHHIHRDFAKPTSPRTMLNALYSLVSSDRRSAMVDRGLMNDRHFSINLRSIDNSNWKPNHRIDMCSSRASRGYMIRHSLRRLIFWILFWFWNWIGN